MMTAPIVVALLELGIAATYVASVLLILALIALGVLWLTSGPPRYRCADCSAELPTWDLLLAHEAGHRRRALTDDRTDR